MLRTLKKFFAFCGEDNRKMFIISIWLGVVSAICSAMRIPAAAIVIQALLERNVTMATLWTSLGIIVASLIVTIAINMKATMLQTRAGYRACANKRIEIAEHLRYLPMGWFNDNSLGEVTSVTTNTMENMANIATRVVMVTTRGFLTSGIIAAMMFLFDWRMGLITLTGLVLFFAVNAAMQRAEQTLSQRKFNADERLVSKVLEYVQGIAEVKNFDLTHDSATQVHGAVEEARRASFAMEIPSVLYMLAQFVVKMCIRDSSYTDDIAQVTTIVGEAAEVLSGEDMQRPERAEKLPADNAVELKDVRFAYHDKEVLHGIDLHIAPGTVNALVGPSGSGKSTIARLIASLWDVKDGEIDLGGVDIRTLPLAECTKPVSYTPLSRSDSTSNIL